jgi:hypothetical protein
MGIRTWRAASVALLAGAAGLVAACGSDGDDTTESSATEAAATTSTVAAEPTTTAVAAAAETTAADVPTVAVDDRLGTRLEIPGGPDYLAVVGEAVWVKTDAGKVVPVDAATTTVGTGVAVSDELCQGLGAGDDVLWTCSGETGDVVRVDPAAGTVAATVAAGKINAQGQIPVAFAHAWVLVGDGSQLAGIAGDAVDTTIELGTVCTELAASSTAIWAVCPDEGVAVKVDPATGEVAGRVADLPGAIAIAAGEQVWVGFEGGVARIDDETATTTAVADTGPLGFGAGLTVAPDAVWLRVEGRFLRRIDPATATVVEELHAPEQSSGSITVAFGSVWTTAYDDNVLYRLDPE